MITTNVSYKKVTVKFLTPKQLIARKIYQDINITEEEFSNMLIGPEADDSIEKQASLKLQEFRPTLF